MRAFNRFMVVNGLRLERARRAQDAAWLRATAEAKTGDEVRAAVAEYERHQRTVRRLLGRVARARRWLRARRDVRRARASR